MYYSVWNDTRIEPCGHKHGSRKQAAICLKRQIEKGLISSRKAARILEIKKPTKLPF